MFAQRDLTGFYRTAFQRIGGLFRSVGAWAVGADPTGSSALSDYRILATFVGIAGFVALLAVPNLPGWARPFGLLLGGVYYWVFSRRERRRHKVFSQPFPQRWRQTLMDRVPLYGQLTAEEKRRFEGEIAVFLDEQRIYSLGGLEGDDAALVQLTDEHRVLIASSAAMLLLGRPDWRLPTDRDIVIYPAAFQEETYTMDRHAHTLGMVHAQGPILFALDALENSFPRQPSWQPLHLPFSETPSPPSSHVGLHEFAHVLDFLGQQGRSTGVPVILPAQTQAVWHAQLSFERERLLAGNSVLNPYGLKNEAEMFAVSVESFFQDAKRLQQLHPDLYRLLAEFFNQDPAHRDSRHAVSSVSYRPWFSIGPTTRYMA